MTEAEKQYMINEIVEQLNQTMIDINKLPTGNANFGGTLLIAQDNQLVKNDVNSFEGIYDISFEESVDGSGVITVGLKNATGNVIRTQQFKIHSDRIAAIEKDLYLGHLIEGLNYAVTTTGTAASNGESFVELNSNFTPRMDSGIYINCNINLQASAKEGETVLLKLIHNEWSSSLLYEINTPDVQEFDFCGQIPQNNIEDDTPYRLQIINNTSSDIIYSNPIVRYYRLGLVDIVSNNTQEIRKLKKDIENITVSGDFYTKAETDELLDEKLDLDSIISESDINNLIK